RCHGQQNGTRQSAVRTRHHRDRFSVFVPPKVDTFENDVSDCEAHRDDLVVEDAIVTSLAGYTRSQEILGGGNERVPRPARRHRGGGASSAFHVQGGGAQVDETGPWVCLDRKVS